MQKGKSKKELKKRLKLEENTVCQKGKSRRGVKETQKRFKL